MAATNEQSSMLVPLRGEDLAEGPNDNLQPHEISTLLIQQGNIDEQLHKISTLLIQEGNLDSRASRFCQPRGGLKLRVTNTLRTRRG